MSAAISLAPGVARGPRADVFDSIVAQAGGTYFSYGDPVIAAYERCEASECWTTRQPGEVVNALTRAGR